MRELLDNRGKIPCKDVQVIVYCNDYMANRVIEELQRREVLIPDQVAVTGFDDILISSCMIPSLSTVCYLFATLAAKAAGILLKLIAGKPAPELASVTTRFIPAIPAAARIPWTRLTHWWIWRIAPLKKRSYSVEWRSRKTSI